ncbi:MAG: GspH/FimT family pseudopilin [Caulobacter sp.]
MTRTSATGTDAPARRGGFTLIELMVVVAILGLMAAVVVVAIPSGTTTLASEGERFAARLKRAQEEAILTGRGVAVTFTDRGYAFQHHRAGAWSPLEDGHFRAVAWEPGTRAERTDDLERMDFDPTGLATPAQVVLRRDAASVRIAVDAAGTVTFDAR